MFKFVILLSAVACAFVAAYPEELPPSLDGRILGGNNTSIYDHPYHVSVQRLFKHICSGCIISSLFVVTTAQCFTQKTFLGVRAGSNTWNTGGIYHSVQQLIIHENFNITTHENDIALLRLILPLPLLLPNIRPISLANESPTEGAVAIVTGWFGLTSGSNSPSNTLQDLNVNIFSDNECLEAYGSQFTEGKVCAARPWGDACQRHTGNPLVSRGNLDGLLSWSIDCASSAVPDVYTKISSYLDWIESNV